MTLDWAAAYVDRGDGSSTLTSGGSMNVAGNSEVVVGITGKLEVGDEAKLEGGSILTVDGTLTVDAGGSRAWTTAPMSRSLASSPIKGP